MLVYWNGLHCLFNFQCFYGIYFLLLDKKARNLTKSHQLAFLKKSRIGETSHFFTFILILDRKYAFWFSLLRCWHSTLKRPKRMKFNFWQDCLGYSNFIVHNFSFHKIQLFAFHHLYLAKIQIARIYIWLDKSWGVLFNYIFCKLHPFKSDSFSIALVQRLTKIHFGFFTTCWVSFAQLFYSSVQFLHQKDCLFLGACISRNQFVFICIDRTNLANLW